LGETNKSEMATTAAADSSMQMQNYSNQNQERYVPLSMILDNAIQKTYHQLMLMIDMYLDSCLIKIWIS
jgi:hypothetical protein